MVRLGVLVSGNGSNLQALLDAQARGELTAEIATVISNRPGVRALERAALAGVPALCISHREHPTREAFDQRLVAELRERKVDWVVFAGFMRLVTPIFLEAFPNRVLNIHPSLLPAFPGVDAGKQAFEYGVKVSGCTVHLVSGEMDAGPVIAQTPVSILETDTLESFMERMHSAEHKLLVSATQAAVTGRISLIAPLNPGGRHRVRLLDS
jgi:phosphoribosylglycinamide formyltransferase-1